MNHAVELTMLYDNLEQTGIDVVSLPLGSYDALASPRGYLAINPARVHTEAHERELLIHEEGHFATGTFYELDSPYAVRGHQEAIACRYGFKKYFPLDTLLDLMEDGCTEPWELAEQLGVGEPYVRKMLDYYTEARGVDFNAELERRRLERDEEPDDPAVTPEALARLEAVAAAALGHTDAQAEAQETPQPVALARVRASHAGDE